MAKRQNQVDKILAAHRELARKGGGDCANASVKRADSVARAARRNASPEEIAAADAVIKSDPAAFDF
jgi:hypothetical protein